MDFSDCGLDALEYAIEAMLAKYAKSVGSPIYYMAGPPGMVSAMRTLLSGMGVDDDDIRTEEFAGY